MKGEFWNVKIVFLKFKRGWKYLLIAYLGLNIMVYKLDEECVYVMNCCCVLFF